ncbi:unnamed protein product [marine sediment metagenome]|uniref:Uncharacterized protein n=1 Tax=marine sediment metagenome TaxID=412755 RepID=X1FBE1_9ZZZZ
MTIYGEDVQCSSCGEKHTYDRVTGYECLVLIDGRDRPNLVIGAWCNEACLNDWLDSPAAKVLFPTM